MLIVRPLPAGFVTLFACLYLITFLLRCNGVSSLHNEHWVYFLVIQRFEQVACGETFCVAIVTTAVKRQVVAWGTGLDPGKPLGCVVARMER